MTDTVYERSPITALQGHINGGLEAGKLGVIVAPAGVGKSALLVHVALDSLLRENKVLHVTLRDSVEHVHAHYDEVFRAASHNAGMRDKTNASVVAERNRMIHSYVDRPFDVGHLGDNLSMLGDVAGFKPTLVVVDGVSDADVLAGLAGLAKTRGFKLWATLHSADGVPGQATEHATVALQLVPRGRSVEIVHEGETLPVHLDPTTMLAIVDDLDSGEASSLSPRPTDATLYSGGANGSEAAFGAAAEKWGVTEVNFTFEGHKQSRNRGRYELSPRELAAGDVSLVYVSRRLNRTYSEGSLIRRVLQTLWHMVSRSQQVFVIGQIQEDGTVVGGTGWSVELARMWNKDLWVYDQDKKAWHRWDGHQWNLGTPVVSSVHFTGTGTRYLTDEGRAAVDDLFRRSFAQREG